MSEVDENVGAGVGDAGAGTESQNESGSVLFADENKPVQPSGDVGKGDVAAGETQAEKVATDVVDKVPEDGNYDLKMPEGVPLDEGLFRALSPEFKELGLTQGQAQRLVDSYIKAQTGRMEANGESFSAITQGWIEEAKADKEIGGDKWDGTVQVARRAVEQLATPLLRDYLNQSGAGNHPEMIRFMARVGAMIGEDKPPQGGSGRVGKEMDAAHILFAKDVMNKQ